MIKTESEQGKLDGTMLMGPQQTQETCLVRHLERDATPFSHSYRNQYGADHRTNEWEYFLRDLEPNPLSA